MPSYAWKAEEHMEASRYSGSTAWSSRTSGESTCWWSRRLADSLALPEHREVPISSVELEPSLAPILR